MQQGVKEQKSSQQMRNNNQALNGQSPRRSGLPGGGRLQSNSIRPIALNGGQGQGQLNSNAAAASARGAQPQNNGAPQEELDFVGFFDTLIHRSLDPLPPNSDTLRIWEELRDTADAYSIMKVRRILKSRSGLNNGAYLNLQSAAAQGGGANSNLNPNVGRDANGNIQPNFQNNVPSNTFMPGAKINSRANVAGAASGAGVNNAQGGIQGTSERIGNFVPPPGASDGGAPTDTQLNNQKQYNNVASSGNVSLYFGGGQSQVPPFQWRSEIWAEFACVLIQEHLFMIHYSRPQNTSAQQQQQNILGSNGAFNQRESEDVHGGGRVGGGTCQLGGENNNAQQQQLQDGSVYLRSPDYYVNVEFTKLRIIKNREGVKTGFALMLRDVTLEFMIMPNQSQLPFLFGSGAGGASNTPFPGAQEEQNAPKRNHSQLAQQAIISAANRRASSTSQIKGLPAAQSQNLQVNSLNKENQLNLNPVITNTPINNQQQLHGTAAALNQHHLITPTLDALQELKLIFKQWLRTLNEYVVRTESLKKYSISGQIGVGGQAKVYKIIKKVNPTSNTNYNQLQSAKSRQEIDLAARTFAIKIITKKKFEGKPERERIQMMNEIQVQRRLKYCGNTLKLYKIYESDKYLNLLMEFQEGGTLGDKLEKGTVFTEEESKIIMAQLLLTVDFMGRKGIIHRDLKPENVLLNSKQPGNFDIRIGDFGFAITFDSSSQAAPDTKIVCGTAGYIPPEALDGHGYSLKSDLFSLGSVLFSILTQRNLFNGQDYKAIMRSNKQCQVTEYINQYMRKFSQHVRDLVHSLCSRDPEKRPTVEEALSHAWFKHEQIAVMNSLDINQVLTDTMHGTSLPRFHRATRMQSMSSLGAGQLGSFLGGRSISPFRQPQATSHLYEPANSRVGNRPTLSQPRIPLGFGNKSNIECHKFIGTSALNNSLHIGSQINLRRAGASRLASQSKGLPHMEMENSLGQPSHLLKVDVDQNDDMGMIGDQVDNMMVSDMLNQVNYYKILSEFKHSALIERDVSNPRQSNANITQLFQRVTLGYGGGGNGVKSHLAFSGLSHLNLNQIGNGQGGGKEGQSRDHLAKNQLNPDMHSMSSINSAHPIQQKTPQLGGAHRSPQQHRQKARDRRASIQPHGMTSLHVVNPNRRLHKDVVNEHGFKRSEASVQKQPSISDDPSSPTKVGIVQDTNAQKPQAALNNNYLGPNHPLGSSANKYQEFNQRNDAVNLGLKLNPIVLVISQIQRVSPWQRKPQLRPPHQQEFQSRSRALCSMGSNNPQQQITADYLNRVNRPFRQSRIFREPVKHKLRRKSSVTSLISPLRAQTRIRMTQRSSLPILCAPWMEINYKQKNGIAWPTHSSGSREWLALEQIIIWTVQTNKRTTTHSDRRLSSSSRNCNSSVQIRVGKLTKMGAEIHT
ncbi:hypothetical protein FGO68_gene5677 [Halteria grandinella]|uniref:Protein kinase domain-containing protein n=1 Tax=Halteria grandinella TaxID=5974 RepID=A0A8J8SY73_HALGN|nr:hypothetical protein FGO68_gene5677 [Halteria grandinella]